MSRQQFEENHFDLTKMNYRRFKQLKCKPQSHRKSIDWVVLRNKRQTHIQKGEDQSLRLQESERFLRVEKKNQQGNKDWEKIGSAMTGLISLKCEMLKCKRKMQKP